MSARHPFRFAVITAQAGSGEEWLERARRMEALGYGTLVMPDTLGPTMTPVPALGIVAGATRTLRVGTYVLVNDFRNPVLLAREWATLDFLSGGRAELGLGVGRPGADADYQRLGIPLESGGVRVGRLAESLQAIKRELAGGFPRPVQQPRPPIMVAGSGPRLLALAAREADIVTIGAGPQEGADGFLRRIEQIREAAPERIDDLELNTNLIAVGDRLHPMAARAGASLEQVVQSGSPTALTGTPEQMAEQLQRVRQTFGINYVTVWDGAMDTFAPVVERLAGR